MCGITALSRSTPSSIPNARRFAEAAVRAIEVRGAHATGFGWADPTEGWPWYWKSPGRASKVAHRADLPNGIQTLIGHTRYATLGSPSINDNNHPVTAPDVVLVHNGRITNHKALAALSDLPREAEVDSVSLAMMLSTFPDDVLDVLELVEGVAAIAWLHGDDPTGLHLARLSGRPMTYGRTRKGDFVMSSTHETLRATAKLSGVHIERPTSVAEGTYLRVEAGRVTDRKRFKVRPQPTALPLPFDVPALPLKPGERVTHDGLIERLAPWRTETLAR